MTSYNQVNGEPTSQYAHALRDILKEEWGFDGFVVCDWRATFSTGCATAGLDLEMPGPGKFMTVASLKPLVESGAIPQATVDDKVRRLLRAILRSDAVLPNDQRPAGELDSPRHRELARQVAEEAIVLLKNGSSD
jgi:beta-glucosidase